jgi:DNA repair exonuclease SbcCD ATPase subunit
MFIEITLKNFRQHKALTVNFENGVVALRGANEAGKTTLLEAIGYALGGAYMLREPLSEVVTWGEKESTLKVSLAFQINGVRYIITRGKSGAEIRDDEKILAAGQTEVTKYVETLIGCPVKTATQLMLANQQKLRGTLEEDGAAMKLIEQLADFQLIDRIIALVQKHRPCGTTVSVEARIQTLEVQLGEPLVDDTGPFAAAVEAAQKVMDGAGEAYHLAKAAYDAVQEPARQAQQRLAAAAAATGAVTAARERLTNAKVTFDNIKPVPGPAEDEIARLRAAVTEANRWQDAVAAHRLFLTLPEPMWEGTLESLESARTKIGLDASGHASAVNRLRTEIAVAQGQRITQSACGLCGKDLANVPEVVTKNGQLDAKIADLTSQMEISLAAQKEKDAEYAEYSAVVTAHQNAMRTYQRCASFVTMDYAFVPPKATWTGPDVSQPAPANPLADLQAAERKVQQYQMDLGRQQQAKTALDTAAATVEAAVQNEALAAAAVGDAQATLEAAAVATSKLYDAETAFKDAEKAHQSAGTELQHAQRIYQMKLEARQQVEAQLAQAKMDLSAMQFNNVLIDTLRKARPSIVEELWNIVGATVSDTFSRIRGVPSTFLRQDDSFTVDGKGIKGLSGSTLDALGLAIRMSLTKTFLPNTRFMVLDEPAAAADDDRETNMLGVIAASEFEQVLLVTHSDLADSFASQVVRL